MVQRPDPSKQGGFTLAEAAITIALVALTLSTMLQILQGSKFTTAYTRDLRRARDLGLTTLAEIESGLWIDLIDSYRTGNYADKDLPNFSFDLAVGDEGYLGEGLEQEDGTEPFDNWAYQREQDLEDDDDEEEAVEAFEKIKIRVTFPKYGDQRNEIELERWIPWEQVYGEIEEESEEGDSSNQPPSTTGGGQDGENL